MRQLLTLCAVIVCALSLAPVARGDASPQQNPGAADRLSDADLEELLAPIALYPDPLLANVLAASCYPDELAQAARANGNAATIDAANWEPSVKAVAKIPDAMKMLTQYPEWTKALGEAFILQSQDVMKAVQQLRARAYANGSLATTEQQVVQTQGDVIVIQPAQPDIIYVPTYQPSVVYVDHHDDAVVAGVIGFGLGVAAGAIIANNVDCDWWRGGCCYGCGWGWGHGDVDINVNRNINNNVNINNIRNSGNTWSPNRQKLDADIRNGNATALRDFKGVGETGRSAGSIPNRASNAQPIAQQRAAPKPSQARGGGARASGAAPTRAPAAQPMQRPASMDRPAAPKAKPSIPPASQRPPANTSRPSMSMPSKAGSSRPSAYQGGSSHKAASRGAASRGGGGGARGGGGRR